MHQVLDGFPTRFVFDFWLSNLLVLEVVVDQEAVVTEVGEMAVLVESKIVMIFLAQPNVLNFCRLIGLYNVYYVDLNL